MILWRVRFFPFSQFISDFRVLSPISRFCCLKMSPTLRKIAIWLVLLGLHMTFVLDSFILIISHFNKQIHVIYEIKREMASWLYFSLVLKVISGSPSLEIQFERTGVKILWLNSFNFDCTGTQCSVVNLQCDVTDIETEPLFEYKFHRDIAIARDSYSEFDPNNSPLCNGTY